MNAYHFSENGILNWRIRYTAAIETRRWIIYFIIEAL